MSRICKENINTSFFHIMVQGINKEYIFDTKEDITKYMKIMQDTKEKIDMQNIIIKNMIELVMCLGIDTKLSLFIAKSIYIHA